MSAPNHTWRVNQTGMERCCVMALEYEMYRRGGANEDLMVEGDTLKCDRCGSKMICDRGTENRLRWRWNGK